MKETGSRCNALSWILTAKFFLHFFFLPCLLAQSSPTSTNYKPPIWDYAVGVTSSILSKAFLGDITNRSPSLGAFFEARQSIERNVVWLRYRTSYDNWRNQPLIGNPAIRSDVTRFTATAGLVVDVWNGRGGKAGQSYFCLDVGGTRWDITSLCLLSGHYTATKFVTSLSWGWELYEHLFLELGFGVGGYINKEQIDEAVLVDYDGIPSIYGGFSFIVGWRF
ncbi:MAG: hypothetical protein FWG02_03790 [Holophagaceae bacterium]|nr:hypothetical protein [Holophagaceae bacterium]